MQETQSTDSLRFFIIGQGQEIGQSILILHQNSTFLDNIVTFNGICPNIEDDLNQFNQKQLNIIQADHFESPKRVLLTQWENDSERKNHLPTKSKKPKCRKNRSCLR